MRQLYLDSGKYYVAELDYQLEYFEEAHQGNAKKQANGSFNKKKQKNYVNILYNKINKTVTKFNTNLTSNTGHQVDDCATRRLGYLHVGEIVEVNVQTGHACTQTVVIKRAIDHVEVLAHKSVLSQQLVIANGRKVLIGG